MLIRKLKVEDIEKIIFYEKEYFSSTLGKDFIENDLKNNPYARYLVLDDDGFAGYISFNVDLYGEILNFFVVKSQRKKGFGRILLEEAIKEAIDSGALSLSLEVKETNTEAIKLYESCGFKLSHKRKGYYNGVDAFLMIKELK